MKILSIILLLSLSITQDIEESYSFKIFIKEIQKEGYYDMFVEVYHFYKREVTIEVCNGFGYNRNNCEELVEDYIHESSDEAKPRGDESSAGAKPSGPIIIEETPTLESIIMNPKNYNIYAVKHNETDIYNMIEEIKNKYNIKN